ncbi:hypothetical protein BpHYR1_021452 [Brachionus plicatilis]|uniref:Uncharacterized protein n=1 Tax=Brachionus plicatilis TaxID=10195 RepID=A0A3M7SUF0_BRAPC|nr:hypothetical protein BpHYR1_021452 [Brachionus plicatilis]
MIDLKSEFDCSFVKRIDIHDKQSLDKNKDQNERKKRRKFDFSSNKKLYLYYRGKSNLILVKVDLKGEFI